MAFTYSQNEIGKGLDETLMPMESATNVPAYIRGGKVLPQASSHTQRLAHQSFSGRSPGSRGLPHLWARGASL